MRSRGMRALFSALAASALAAGLTVVGLPAQAASYPSWDDINRAKDNEQAKQSQITSVQGLIDGLNQQYTAASAQVQQAQNDLDAAQQRLEQQQQQFDQLRVQQVTAQARADESKRAAGASIAQMYRSGGTNSSVNIYLSGEQADDVLYQLGVMGRIGERSNESYRDAQTDANTASSLQQQADVALGELQRLTDDANAKAQAAASAQTALQNSLTEQQNHAADLAAQLASLQGETETLQQQRAAGIQAEQQARAAAAAAEARRREQEAEQPGGGQAPSGGGQGGAVTAPSSSAVGFPLPYLKASSGYGMRLHPIYNEYRFHYGTDYAVDTGTKALAIANGTVISAGYDSSMGNHVDIRSVVGGQTIIARYFHLSSISVGNGQGVSKGQVIGLTGSTGASTGPHLHFEIHLGSINYGSPLWKTAGNTVDPRLWLASH